MIEKWKDISGFEGRYQVSDLGRVRSVSFRQRYTHWRTGQEMFRTTPGRILATQLINSGYTIAHLHKDNQRTAHLVHRLVAEAFVEGSGATVNHRNGAKTDNRAANLEWATYTENLLHAVHTGLNPQAVPVVDPATGTRYPSISQAARQCRKAHRTIRRDFQRGAKSCQQ